MTETRKPLEVPADRPEKTAQFLNELTETYKNTGTITELQLDWATKSIRLAESLLEATATFVNVADKTVADLEASLAEKDTEITLLNIKLRDFERDLELANADD